MKREVIIERHLKAAIDHAFWWGCAMGMAGGIALGVLIGLRLWS